MVKRLYSSTVALYGAIFLLALVPASEQFGSTCGSETVTLFTDSFLDEEYQTPGFGKYDWKPKGYDTNLYCEVFFKTYYEGDIISIVTKETDMAPRDFTGTCVDRAIFYDGGSTNAPVLGEVCGTERLTLTSTASTVLMVFSTDSVSHGVHKGVDLTAQALDNGGRDAHFSNTVYLPLILGVVIPLVIIICCLVVCCVICARKREAQQGQVITQAAVAHSQQNYNLALQNLQQTAPTHPQGYPGQPANQPHYYTSPQPYHGGPAPYPASHPGTAYPPANQAYPLANQAYPPSAMYDPSSLQPLLPSNQGTIHPSAPPPPAYDDVVKPK